MSSEVTANPTETSHTPLSKRKLRESCNACNQAKVKCDKTQPWCARCTGRGVKCVYSLSLRSGKRRADQSFPKGPTTTTNDSNANQPGLSLKEAATSLPPLPGDMLSPMERAELQNLLNCFSKEPLLGKLDFLAHLESQSQFESKQSQLPGELEHQDTEDSKFDQSQAWVPPSPSRSSLSTLSTMSPFSSLFPLSEVGAGSLTADFHTPNTDDSAAADSSPHHLSSPAHQSNQEFSASISFGQCQCFQLALQKLSSINQVSGSPTITFDVALQQGKEAIFLSASILRCSCRTTDNILVIILASLLSRTLSVYQSLCTVHLTRFPPLGSHEDESKPSQARVTLGAYELDEEDQDRLKLSIIGSELQKAEEVLAIFREQLCPSNNWPLNSPFSSHFSIEVLGVGTRSPPSHPAPSAGQHVSVENHCRLYHELGEILVRDLKAAYGALQGRMHQTGTERRAPWW